MPKEHPELTPPKTGGPLKLTWLDPKEIPLLLSLFNDPDAASFYVPTLRRPYNRKQLEGMLASWDDRSESFLFALRQNGALAGVVNLEGVNWVNRNTEIGIALAGPEYRGQGLAKEAVRLMLDYLFREMGLNRVYCRIMDGNEPSVHLFTSMGFRREGTLRQHIFRDGGFIDLHLLGILAEEWRTSASANNA